ncbi:hypothetical protein [Paenibacillus pabuli]|nr:hypothetical protein [Paenibacillus pabuli]MEC0125201.1 hypothetical protein [Paenibacillus pabuli]
MLNKQTLYDTWCNQNQEMHLREFNANRRPEALVYNPSPGCRLAASHA